MQALLTWVVERVAKFPREHEFAVGDRLVETCLDITSHLIEVSYRRDKHVELSAALRTLVRARVLVWLARTGHCTSEAQHHYFANESDEVGRRSSRSPALVWAASVTRDRTGCVRCAKTVEFFLARAFRAAEITVATGGDPQSTCERGWFNRCGPHLTAVMAGRTGSPSGIDFRL